MNKKKALLVDIDGTLVHITKNWTMERDLEWVEETRNAKPYSVAVKLVERFKKQDYKIVVLTARSNTCRLATDYKFHEIGMSGLVDKVIFRPRHLLYAASVDYKREMIQGLKKNYNIIFSLEDESKNQNMMRQEGINVIDATLWHGIGCSCSSCVD